MVTRKRMVILANSYKKQPGRCVAGREVSETGSIGDWLRPISEEPEGELLPRHMATADGSPLEVLDIVEVSLVRHASDQCHLEDWVIATPKPWKGQGRFPIDKLAELEERPPNLWSEPTIATDRVTSELLLSSKAHQSLYLVRPKNVRIELTNAYNPFENYYQKRRRIRFSYRRQDYSLGLTDPVFIESHATNFPERDKPGVVVKPPFGDRCLLCVSLTPLFHGFHYKVVATVLELP